MIFSVDGEVPLVSTNLSKVAEVLKMENRAQTKLKNFQIRKAA